MKKATLTIGLFSLVMVLTSFTTPETTTSSNNVNLGIDGGMTGGGRKLDIHASAQSLRIDGGMTGGGRKLDVYSSIQNSGIDGGMTGGGRKLD